MGQVYFYNLTTSSIALTVNGFSGDKIDPLPDAPYTPNKSANTYTRWDTDKPAHPNEFGGENTIEYTLDGGAGGQVRLGINVNLARYPTTQDLLVYLYRSAVVVMCPVDSVPYLGKSGQDDPIHVGPGSAQAL